MKKKVISSVLALSMAAALLAGCGNTEASSGTEAQANAGTSADAESTEAASDVNFNGTEITIKMCNTGCVTDDNDRIVAAINEIVEPKLGITVNVEWIGIADYGQQMNLLFSSQETCDIINVTPVLRFSDMLNQDELMDITDYMDQYGQDIESIAANYLPAYTSEGSIYGVPVYREKAGTYWVNMRTDILEELGLVEDAQNMSSWADYEAILDQVKAAYPDLTPCYIASQNNVGTFYDGYYCTGAADWSDAQAIDNLGDGNALVYVDENGQVQSYYTSDIFKDCVENARTFYEAGYANSDATTATDDGVVRCKNNQVFSWIGGGESDNQATTSLNAGMDVTSVAICSGAATSNNVTMWGFAVPYTSENPDAAVAFLNEMYTNADLANLFVWGEEGTDWVTNDEGFAEYANGTDAAYHSCTWLTPNALLLTPWTGAADVATQQSVIDSEVPSEYLGFYASTADIEQTITACVNVKNEYRDALVCGVAGDNTDAMLEEFCSKLEAAGIEDVVAAYQEQLDAWTAANQ